MTPERWQRLAKDYIVKDDIGSFTIPGQPNINPAEASALLEAAPWLAKQPVTDKLYGISGGGLEVSHLADELKNALNAETSGLPPELALRPESLDRMSFAAAAERVGRINQFRAKEMERAALSNLDSPAVQTFKEYTDDNPMGLRWTELTAPEGTVKPNQAALAENSDDWLDPGYVALRDALKYEGDTMGHCVGGYCPDVMEGRSRIFSLRDAKGEPHVTIETAPVRTTISDSDYLKFYQEAAGQLGVPVPRSWNDMPEEGYRELDTLARKLAAEYEAANAQGAQDIIQIKGKQNRAPKDDYLPFVQDFVKSGKWSNVGDFGNTGLVKLPDGRYITARQAEEGITAIPERVGNAVYDPTYLHAMDPEIWKQVAPYFEGFAVGGRVSADRCFSRHPMSVKR